jgi:signal transduction histidine kinase
MEPTIWTIGVLAAAFLGWLLGARSGRSRVDAVLRTLAADLRAGRRPETARDSNDGMRAVREALDERWATKNEERGQALREAFGRMAAFLKDGVRNPLADAMGGSAEQLREGAAAAVGAIEDLEFFLREPLTPDETHNLVPVVQQATREFTTDWEIAVRLRAPDHPVRVHIHRDSFLDALYLLLHNAGRFGGGKTIDVTVSDRDGQAVVAVRDHGPGFTAEALERAHDLFYTTTESGLGLGIPFARKVVESLGGTMELRNREGGGAEVSVSLPRG